MIIIKYMGSKSRIAKNIVPIIQQYIDANDIKTYVEPFCGGCNVIDKIKCETKIASDKQKYLIALYKNLHRISELPEFVSKEHYSEVRDCFNKNLNTYEDWYIGAIGFLASYNGRFFDGGYAKSGYEKTKNGERYRDYYQESKNNLLTQAKQPLFKDVIFQCADYKDCVDVHKPKNCVIYCDPPYENTKQFSNSKWFNHNLFWDIMRKLSENNIVLISELNAPDDFECIWQQEVSRSIKSADKSKAVEKLFKMKVT